MNVWARSFLAILRAAITYALYVFLPTILLTYLDTDVLFATYLPTLDITIGNIDGLVFYISSIGFIMTGLSFAYNIAEKDSKIRPIWKIFQIFFKLVFWGIFIYVGFSVIHVETPILGGIDFIIDIDITVLFWFMMGASIFDIVTTVLDFFIAFIPKKEEVEF